MPAPNGRSRVLSDPFGWHLSTAELWARATFVVVKAEEEHRERSGMPVAGWQGRRLRGEIVLF